MYSRPSLRSSLQMRRGDIQYKPFGETPTTPFVTFGHRSLSSTFTALTPAQFWTSSAGQPKRVSVLIQKQQDQFQTLPQVQIKTLDLRTKPTIVFKKIQLPSSKKMHFKLPVQNLVMPQLTKQTVSHVNYNSQSVNQSLLVQKLSQNYFKNRALPQKPVVIAIKSKAERKCIVLEQQQQESFTSEETECWP